jgi:cell division protein FtsB
MFDGFLVRLAGLSSFGRPMTWLNRILLALLIAAGIALLPHYDTSGGEDLERVVGEREALTLSNAELRREIALLGAEVRALHADPKDRGSGERAERELARIAREDLNLVKPGEMVFEIVPAQERP